MPETKPTERRKFLGACGSLGVALACMPWKTMASGSGPRLSGYAKALLVDKGQRAIRLDELAIEREYVFYYPYHSTPCFLLNLGKTLEANGPLRTENGSTYRWRGGIGPERSIVAFSAICAHKLTHVSPSVSFIGYRKEAVGFLNGEQQIERRAGVIQCCSERSIYDPADGARVIAGPARQPLAAIELVEEENRLYATGVYGGELFHRYFAEFEQRLGLEYGFDRYSKPVTTTAVVVPSEQATKNRIECA